MIDRFKIICTVYALFIKDGQILLYRRVNTDWQNGKYNVPGGHLEEKESVLEATVREAKEETGIDIKEEDLELVHVLNRVFKPGISVESNRDNLDLFFRVKDWLGEPQVTEENKNEDMIWADLNKLPEDLLNFEKHVLNQINQNKLYSQFSG